MPGRTEALPGTHPHVPWVVFDDRAAVGTVTSAGASCRLVTAARHGSAAAALLLEERPAVLLLATAAVAAAAVAATFEQAAEEARLFAGVARIAAADRSRLAAAMNRSRGTAGNRSRGTALHRGGSAALGSRSTTFRSRGTALGRGSAAARSRSAATMAFVTEQVQQTGVGLGGTGETDRQRGSKFCPLHLSIS